jgi:hypothetical protein
MEVEEAGAGVGFAGEAYDPARDGETDKSTAYVCLCDGTTYINSGLSLDEEDHNYYGHLGSHIPSLLPFEMALRVDHDRNVPQVQFNVRGRCVARLYTPQPRRRRDGAECKAVVPLSLAE